MPTIVRDRVGGLISGAHQFRMGVQQDGRLQFTGVHVGEKRGLHSGPHPGRLPVVKTGEQRHSDITAESFLHHISQNVISAMSVDHDQRFHTGPVQGTRDVTDHRMQRRGGNTDGPRPRRVFVGTGDRHRRKELHRISTGDLSRDRAGHDRVRDQRKERTVLFETSDRKDRDPSTPGPYLLGGVLRQQTRPTRTAHVFPAFPFRNHSPTTGSSSHTADTDQDRI